MFQDISRNFIGSHGIEPLIELFQNNKTLISIDISSESLASWFFIASKT